RSRRSQVRILSRALPNLDKPRFPRHLGPLTGVTALNRAAPSDGPGLAQPICVPRFGNPRPLMPRRTGWKELIVGLIALAAVTGVCLAVLVFARVGTLHGHTFRLYARTGEARGV